MKKVENFFRALDNLDDIFHYPEPWGNVETTGMVGLYQICFEQSWKAMTEILEDQGYAKTGSPKQVIRTAYQAGMVEDEELWLAALADRNNVAHSYNEDIARGIIRNTKERYRGMFQALRRTMEEEWL